MNKLKSLKKIIIFLGFQSLGFVLNLILIKILRIQQLWIVAFSFYITGIIIIAVYHYYNKNAVNKEEACHNDAKLNRILYELIHSTAQLNTREELYKEILRKTIQAINHASKGCILLLEENNVLSYQAVIGYDEEALKSTFLYMDQTFLYLESKGKIERSVVINNPFEYDKKREQTDNLKKVIEASPYAIKTTLSTPVFINNKLYGMINIDSEVKDAFDKNDIKTMEFFVFEVANVIKLFSSFEHNQYLLNRDVLTGCFNRRYINHTLNKKMREIGQTDIFSVVSFDLNNLKITNDQYGHECGDQMLIHFSRGIEKLISKDDIFARYGGDEFLLFIGNQDPKFVMNIIKQSKEYFEHNPLLFKEFQLKVSFSYGISNYPKDGHTIDALIKLADAEMYVRKRDYHLQNFR